MPTGKQRQGPVSAAALTRDGQAAVKDMAARHGISPEAAAAMLQAVHAGNGTQAQFDHPELGGLGQWSSGGMLMIGDMFNYALKAKVAALADDAASLLKSHALFEIPASAMGAQPRWPAALGRPSSVGSQNDAHYAVFPATRRLAIEQAGQLSVYDTGDHRITGVSQQQSGTGTVSFTSQHGTVTTGDLQRVDDASVPPEPSAAVSSRKDENVFEKLEGLANLHGKGILGDDEYAAKKAELLARL